MRIFWRGLAVALLGIGLATGVQAQGKLIATGTFIYAEPTAPDGGEGSVSVYDDAVVLGADFKVEPGPDLKVYLVAKTKVRTSQDVLDATHVSLGALQAPEGGQTYALPAGVKLADYPSVVIWCETYSVLFSPADLTFEGGYGHFTSGGMDDRIESTLPPVLSPKIVPRS